MTAFWRGDLSIRLLSVITRQLLRDPSSALMQAVAPIETRWGPVEYLLADLLDVTMAAHFKDPKPYPRPGDAERETARQEQRLEALQAQRERIRARQVAEGAT